MDILYLLIPLSAVLVLMILGVFGWALSRGQFEDVEREGERILYDEGVMVEDSQESCKGVPEQWFASVPEESGTPVAAARAEEAEQSEDQKLEDEKPDPSGK
ncbi:MAG TPA: cbb3-type cytochrome oxidase assembly protein CcoS [Rubrivivax sp.]|nr:cbb3-type cytochrome oxidase assembly protein CcoS [Burkholderiales bacterium]HNT40375.1 cbb3-type cytochrome oxidase assembly protein CcoS [Rubrivivax sp.]